LTGTINALPALTTCDLRMNTVLYEGNNVICISDADECLTVISIWNSLGGSASQFPNSGVCCGINGVTCNTGNTTVTGIEWNSKGLSGAIPNSIGLLTGLTKLYLYTNTLTSMPSTIKNLVSLTDFRFYGNWFTMLPPEIGFLTQLTTLYFYSDNANANLQCVTAIALWTAFRKPASSFPTAGLCCGVNGVTCNPGKTIVTEIDWNSQGLVGSIPTVIRTLTGLTKL
jgi:Leucine-rich repeat (LRR) protein